MTNLEKYSQDIIVLEDIEIEKIQCLNCGEFYEKEYIDDNGDIIENSCNSEKCNDISDMEDCYEYFLSNNDERKCMHCNCSSDQKTLFCIYRNRLDPYYWNDEDYSNDKNIICRDCFFNVCSCCGYKGVNQFASSAPYDCACSECWSKCNFLHGECCNCGEFDYLDFVRTRDEYIVNSEFENHHNRDNLKLYCFYCLEGIYESNFELEEQGYISKVKTNKKCNCCLRNIKSKDTECIYGSVSKERNRRIKNRNHEIENVLEGVFDNLLSRYFVSFEMGDIKTEKEKRLKIHRIRYRAKSRFELPNKYTREEFEFWVQEHGVIDGDNLMDLCSDCLLYGILKNLLKFGKFPRYEYEVERFMDAKSLDDMRDLFDREYDLVSQINLNKSFDTFKFDSSNIYNFMRINDYTNDILIGKLLFNNNEEYENYNTDDYMEKGRNRCKSIKTEFSINVNKIKLVSKIKN